MADQQERTTGNGDAEARYIEERKQQIREVKDSLSLLALLEEIQAEAADVERSTRDKIEEGKKAELSELPNDGKAGDKISLRHKYIDTGLTTKEIIKKLKDNPSLIPSTAGATGQEIIKNILSQIENPDIELGSASASYVIKLINKALRGGISNPLEALSQDELRDLQSADQVTGKKIVTVLTESARKTGVNQTDIDQFKVEVEIEPDLPQNTQQAKDLLQKMGGKGEFADLGIQALDEFYSEEDVPALEALGSIGKFSTYAEKIATEVKARTENQNLAQDVLDRKISSEIEANIAVTFSKLFRKVDQEKPKEFFEKITQTGTYFNSIEIVYTQLLRKIELLTEGAERLKKANKLPSALENMHFFRRYSDDSLSHTTVKSAEMRGGELVEKETNRERINPVPKEENVSLGEFFTTVHRLVENQYDALRYLHNVQAIFTRGKGEKGFWDQLKQYSSELGTTAIDSFMLLPDSDLFMSAYRLYTKHVEEKFALHDWIHQPNIFSNDFLTARSKIEEQVLKDIEKLYPEIAQDRWRLRRAINLGTGLAKGVFLTEIEAAAWADPVVREDDSGASTFESYYTNDSAALQTLNPLHHFLRWQQEGILKGPTLFMPVEGYKRSMFGVWDHSKLWERMNAFRNSWAKGQDAYDKFKNPGEKTFFEIMPNIGHVGSFITRSGWRFDGATEYWMKYDGNNLNVFESWKAIENIGYEALSYFINRRIKGDFLQSGGAARDAFFEYLNERYINFDNGTGGVRKSLGDEFELTRRQLQEEWKKDPHKKRSEVSDKDIYERLLYKSLAGVLRNRIPTKFIRIERDRLSHKGLRAWEVIRQDMKWDQTQMDKAMKNLMLVELKLRQETTIEMTNYLQSPGASLENFDGRKFVVTDANIKKILTDAGLDQAEISNATSLFDKINNRYLQNSEFINEFAKKVQNKEFPFSIAAEELETKFLAFRAAGESVLSRAMGDTSKVEQEVSDLLQNYLDLLHKTSIDPRHDLSGMLDGLEKMKHAIEEIHGPAEAFKFAHHMIGFSVAYFRKDTVAKNYIGKIARTGKYNSIAAEVAGVWSGVWEWEAAEIDNFIVEITRRRIVPREAHELNKAPEIEPRKKLFGLIPMGNKIKYDPVFEFTGKKLRRDFGATVLDRVSEFTHKYLPLILLFILYQIIAKAAKEEIGGGNK